MTERDEIIRLFDTAYRALASIESQYAQLPRATNDRINEALERLLEAIVSYCPDSTEYDAATNSPRGVVTGIMAPEEIETGLNAVIETVLESVELALPKLPGTDQLRAEVIQTVRDACSNHWDEILAVFYEKASD